MNNKKILQALILLTIIVIIVLASVLAWKVYNIYIGSTEFGKYMVTTDGTLDKGGSGIKDTQDQTQTPNFVKTINSNSEKISGNISWGVINFNKNFQYTNISKALPSASIIKVFIMEYIFDLESRNKISLNDNIKGSNVKVLLENMITKSDNNATNVFIEEFGMNELNSFFAEKGYSDTKLERKMLDTAAMEKGKENYTSVNDVLCFLNKIYSNKSDYPYSEMISIMKRQERRNKIPYKIPKGVQIANKTGELSNVENDIGIIFTENGDVAMAFMCSSLSDCAGTRQFIADSASLIYNYYFNNAKEE